MRILTANEMQKLDRLTVERASISWATLMETAGMRVAEAILARSQHRFFTIFCGKGNNGGDGAVIARHLWMRGAASIEVFLFGKLDEAKGEARINFEAIKKLAEMEAISGGGKIIFTEITSEEKAEIQIDHGCVVDALFGTGLTRPVEGLYARAIEIINRAKAAQPGMVTVVAVDIPSGLSSDIAHPIGLHVKADITISFTAPKIGNVLPPACDANGELIIASIGTPAQLIAATQSRLFLVDEAEIVAWLHASRRTAGAYKNAVGDVLLIAGSRGKTGAAALASEAVLRAGAGLITVATPSSAQELLVAQALPEVMTEALDETESGAITLGALVPALNLAARRTVVAIGPGLSSSEESTRAFVRAFIEKRKTPVIIDADGLNALAPWPNDLRGSAELPIIITPHPGEMARLAGKTNAEILADRIAVTRAFALSHHVITVLKGQRTLIAPPTGEVYVNPTGNAGMATAGAGDVLTGVIAGLFSQRPSSPLDAVIAAVYLHGLAGDIAAHELGKRSLIASNIIEYLPQAILRLRGEEEKE